jgi:hypothetical protein
MKEGEDKRMRKETPSFLARPFLPLSDKRGSFSSEK